MDNTIKEENTINNPKNKRLLNLILVISLFLIVSFYLLKSPIREKDVIVHIGPNDTLTSISSVLEQKKVINNKFTFKMFVLFLGGDKHISKGDYLFVKGEPLYKVAWQISRGLHGVDPVRITIKEGMTNDQIAKLLADKIYSFRKDLFLSDERARQGYLFPDTYFMYPMTTTDEILVEMTSNFSKKISSIDKEIKSSGKSLSDIIIMASILEKEASGKNDSPIISGILWKRLEMGMLLQVDAAPITYDKIGLPKNPISNPGLSTIMYAINPSSSPYLFYLHDDERNVHYASDFSEHRSNISKYLK